MISFNLLWQVSNKEASKITKDIDLVRNSNK